MEQKLEHRKAIRKKLMAFTPVYDANHKILLGYVMNLSLLGIRVVGEKTVETNTDRVLKIEFPTDLSDLPSTHVTIPAHAVWCKPDEGHRGFFHTGFEFIAVTPDQNQLFQAILTRYQFRQDIPR